MVSIPCVQIVTIQCFYFNCSSYIVDPPSASTLSSIPNNTTVLRGSPVSLICSTDANPDKLVYVFWFGGNDIGVSNSSVLNVTIETDGVYACFPNNAIGTGQATIIFTVVGMLVAKSACVSYLELSFPLRVFLCSNVLFLMFEMFCLWVWCYR